MDNIQLKGERFSNTSGEASFGSASIRRAGVTGRTHYITDLSASSTDATATIVLFSSSTNFWQDRLGGTGSVYNKIFSSPIRIPIGSAVSVDVRYGSSGSAYCNISGYFT